MFYITTEGFKNDQADGIQILADTSYAIKNDSIYYKISNGSDGAVELGDPSCWRNFHVKLTKDGYEIPIQFMVKMDPRCLTRIVELDAGKMLHTKVPFSVTQLFYIPKDGEYDLQIEYSGGIRKNGMIINKYGTVLRSNSVTVYLKASVD